MKTDIKKSYNEYSSKIGDRKALYKAVIDKYSLKNCLYPGSHIDISPSLVIPEVTYVDNFKGAIKFFKEEKDIKDFIDKNKECKEESIFKFIGKDYFDDLDIPQVDLIISEYAGFVGQATKRYLKIGGILLANDSHGDATLARFDEDFLFIGVVNSNNKIASSSLEKYFTLKNEEKINLDLVKSKMKGLKYIKTANNYIFKKVK